jgi:hypothetical protein
VIYIVSARYILDVAQYIQSGASEINEPEVKFINKKMKILSDVSVEDGAGILSVRHPTMHFRVHAQ